MYCVTTSLSFCPTRQAEWSSRRLDFPGAVSQGFDLPDARLMIASAIEDLAQLLLEEGKPLPTPTADAAAFDADLIELVPLSVQVGAHRV